MKRMSQSIVLTLMGTSIAITGCGTQRCEPYPEDRHLPLDLQRSTCSGTRSGHVMGGSGIRTGGAVVGGGSSPTTHGSVSRGGFGGSSHSVGG